MAPRIAHLGPCIISDCLVGFVMGPLGPSLPIPSSRGSGDGAYLLLADRNLTELLRPVLGRRIVTEWQW